MLGEWAHVRLLQISAAPSADVVEASAKQLGHAIYTTEMGEDVADLLDRYAYKAILVDEQKLPDMTAESVVQSLRSRRIGVPVFVLCDEAVPRSPLLRVPQVAGYIQRSRIGEDLGPTIDRYC